MCITFTNRQSVQWLVLLDDGVLTDIKHDFFAIVLKEPVTDNNFVLEELLKREDNLNKKQKSSDMNSLANHNFESVPAPRNRVAINMEMFWQYIWKETFFRLISLCTVAPGFPLLTGRSLMSVCSKPYSPDSHRFLQSKRINFNYEYCAFACHLYTR